MTHNSYHSALFAHIETDKVLWVCNNGQQLNSPMWSISSLTINTSTASQAIWRLGIQVFVTLALATILSTLIMNRLGPMLKDKWIGTHVVSPAPFADAVVLEAHLLSVSKSEWPSRIAEIEATLGNAIKIKISPKEDVAKRQGLSEELIAALDQGKSIFRQTSYFSPHNILFAYRRLGDTGHIIETELKTSHYWTEREMDSLKRIRYVNLAIFILIVMLLWLFPFWRNTHRLLRVAEHFGKGNLSFRLKISRYAALYPIVQSLNALAVRIEVLLTSHKSLVNSAAHELRTPLTRLKYAQRLAHEASSTGELQHYLKQAEREVSALDELIDELLFYAQLDRNDTSAVNIVSLSSEQWIFDRVAAARGLAAAIAPEITISYKNSTSLLVGERRSLDRIASNLIGNAIRYASSTVQIKLDETVDGFLFSVEDDGAGISITDRKRIFEPFVRLDESRQKAGSGGTGLGLAIVARIAEMHGGYAVAEASQLGGAKIIVTWPRKFASAEHPTNTVSASNS